MITAFNNVVPPFPDKSQKVETIRDWGKERAVPASGKPIGGEELSQKKSDPRHAKCWCMNSTQTQVWLDFANHTVSPRSYGVEIMNSQFGKR